MIKGIEHVAILAGDSASLKDWYIRVFGFRMVNDYGNGTYFVMAPDQSMLEIIKAEEPSAINGLKTRGIRHIAFTISNDKFEDMVALLKKEKVKVVTEVTITANGTRTFFFRDPEGNIIHLIDRPQLLG